MPAPLVHIEQVRQSTLLKNVANERKCTFNKNSVEKANGPLH